VRGLPHQTLVDLSLRAQGVISTCWTALLAAPPNGAPAPEPGDRLLTAKQAAQLLGIARTTLYQQRHKFPFYVEVNGLPRFSQHGIKEFIRVKQQGA
jgi:predicted DNA-binding transcriptional regulator AlpA